MKVLDSAIGLPSMMNLLELAVDSQLEVGPRQQTLGCHSEMNPLELEFDSMLMIGVLPEPAADSLSMIFPQLQIDPLLD